MLAYDFNFAEVFAYRDLLLRGVWLTIQLTLLSAVFGLALGVSGAVARSSGPRWLRLIVGAYVEVIRNTPFIVQLFFLFFGLPGLGLRLSADGAHPVSTGHPAQP